MSKLRVGVVGLGNVAELHLMGCKNISQVEIVAGAEINLNRLNEMAAKWSFKGYSDYNQMISKEHLDIILICSPPPYHKEMTIRAAQKAINILCEKPMALSVEDAIAMMDACNQYNVKFYYGSSYRCLPPCVKAKKMIDEGRIGEIQFMSENSLGGKGLEKWKGMSSNLYPIGGPGGGAMGVIDHGMHLIDIFSWFSKSTVNSIFGRANYSGKMPQTEHLTMIFDNGAVGQLVYNDATFIAKLPGEGVFNEGMSWATNGELLPAGCWDSDPQCIKIYGTKGSLLIYHYANKMYFSDENGVQEILINGPVNPEHFGKQMENFAKAIIENNEPDVTAIDGINALKVALACYESNESQSVISVSIK